MGMSWIPQEMNGGSGRRRKYRGFVSQGGMERWHSLCILHAFFHTISSTS